MLNKRIFSFELDILKIGNPPMEIGKVKQLDGTTLNITLKNGEKNMDLSDCIVRLFFKRYDGYSAYQKTQIEVVGDNTVRIECIDEIFELVGDVTLEVEINDMDGYVITSPEFKIKVIDKIGDDEDREIIRVEEVSLLEELKNYVEASVIEIDNFKEMLGELSSPDYHTLLEQLIDTKETVIKLQPQVDASIESLQGKINEAEEKQIEINLNEEKIQNNEQDRSHAELEREAEEKLRKESELRRLSAENNRALAEEDRENAEGLRLLFENSRKNNEETRQSNELERVQAEDLRVVAEMDRVEKDTMRDEIVGNIKNEVEDLAEKVDGFSANGNFSTDLVIKGNVYPTLDGKKPTHFGPPTKDAGNVIMPYARAIGGLTKDGTGVRTIGFIAKPMDANADLDITEEQNNDAVFLGTNVSQLFLYSKEKYPTIVSEGELSPMATQDWVMRLVEGLGLLSGIGDATPAQTTSTPSVMFNMTETNQWSTVSGNWMLSDEQKGVMLPDGEKGLYKPIIAHENFNEITYVKGGQVEDARNDVFIGLWKTENHIYGCRIINNTLNISYFGTNGVRGGANTFTIRDTIKPGDTITMHYNFSNDIWEIYKFDPNNEPVLVYQMSKFMMSGFPEFYNGKNVKPTLSFLINEKGGIQLADCPNPGPIRDHNTAMDYIF